ncbi:IS66 family transposase [Methylohalobius crimeensis]|uniref:IS66 family transposase n=1 Tax=Methylohalobius crimeensis TaxID=244365 RepID=UPI0003B6137D|nr:transposase [Methylohalobius crimeensis]
MWSLSTDQAAYFLTHYSRGKGAANVLLGDINGILVTDRHGGYNDYDLANKRLGVSVYQALRTICTQGMTEGKVTFRLPIPKPQPLPLPPRERLPGKVWLKPKGRIRALQADQDAALQQRICDAIDTATANGESDGGQVPLGDLETQLLAEVIPLRDDGLPDRDDLQGVAVFLMELGLSQVVNLEGIAKIFELTPSESAEDRRRLPDSIAPFGHKGLTADRGETNVTVAEGRGVGEFSHGGRFLIIFSIPSRHRPPYRYGRNCKDRAFYRR